MLKRSLKLESFTDELKCPECGQVLKLGGVELTGLHGVIYSNHLGSRKCAWQKEIGVQITTHQSYSFSKMASRCDIRKSTPLEQRPLCACGCGGRVDYSSIRRKWNHFIVSHYQSHRNISDVLKEMVRLRIDNQVSLRQLLKSSKYASKCAVRMEKKGWIRREKALVNGRWTYRLILLRDGGESKVLVDGEV